jgi:zinc finger SWIM domain-containing protein 3
MQEARHLIPSQRQISEMQAFEIETANDSGMKPKIDHEMASQRVGGSSNLGYTHKYHKKHLQTKRQRDLMYGEAGSMLKYFQDRAVVVTTMQFYNFTTQIEWKDSTILLSRI